MEKEATMKIHISANDIKQWGTNDARRAQEQLPLLIWKLILASCTLIRNHHFPFNEGIQYNGFDGYLDADSSSPFVPNGKSIWEFGTNQGCKQKFESDYAKRVKQIEPSEQSEYTFCFVTSQIWNARQSAAEVTVEKEKDSHWKNIRIYDAADIEMWLEQYPAVAIWFSSVLGKKFNGVCSFREYWNSVTEGTNPSLTPDFFVEGRPSILGEFKEKIAGSKRQLVLRAESPLEAVLVLASEMVLAGEREEKLFDRCVIVDDLSQLEVEQLELEDAIAILNPKGCKVRAISLPIACTVVVPICNYDSLDKISEKGEKIEIQKRSRHSFCRGLEKIGCSSEEAYQLTSETWMSVTALYRKIAINPTSRLPSWIDTTDNSQLIPAMLVSQWEDTADGDKQIIEALSQKGYREYIETIRKYIQSDDAPIKNIAEVYACVTASDMWALLWGSITKQNILDVLENVKKVFSIPDAKYDLSRDKWHCAELYGKKSCFSARLKNGLLHSVFMLSKMGSRDRDSILSDIPERCDSTIGSVLCNISSEKTLFSVIPFLPEMVESCPDVVLTYLEKELSQKSSCVWSAFVPEQNMLFEQSMYWPICWTLEKALWVHRVASMALILMIRIVESDVDEKIKDHFKESIVSVFRIWYPQGSLTKDERKQMLSYISRAYPKTGEYLFLRLLGISGDTATPISFPEWSEEKRSEPHISPLEVHEMYTFILKEFLTSLKPTASQWRIALKHLADLLTIEPKLFDICRSNAKEMQEKDLIQFCSAIAKQIYQFRKFPDTSKSESPEIIARLEELYTDILPNCPEAFLHNFDWNYEGIYPFPYNQKKYDRKQEDAIAQENCNKQMERMISANGKDSFLAIAAKAENQAKFAQAFILLYMNNKFCWDSIKKLRIQSDSCARKVMQELFAQGLFSLEAFPAEQFGMLDAAWILACFEITDHNLAILESLSEEAQQKYWKMVNCLWLEYGDIKLVRKVLPRIADAKRCHKIINHIAYGECFDVPSIIFLLKAVMDEYDDHTIQQNVLNCMSADSVDRLFKKLYAASESYEDTIAELELGYLRVRKDLPTFLLKQLSENPEMFVDVLSRIYIKDGETKGSVSREAVPAAVFYKDFLAQMKVLPGTDLETGQINSDILHRWLLDVSQLSEKRGYKTGCELEIGRLLSYSPSGNDGLWPAECVREYLELYGNETVMEALKVARYNQRGVHYATAGVNERELSRRYERYSLEMEVIYPRTAQMLLGMAKTYDWDSRRESQRELIGY